MRRLATALAVLAVLALSVAFAALNGGQRVTLRLGFITFYRLPLTLVAFGGLIVGMLIMLAASIRSDLKVRRILRDRLAREDAAERSRLFVDRTQQDLFEEADAAGEPRRPPAGPEAEESEKGEEEEPP